MCSWNNGVSYVPYNISTLGAPLEAGRSLYHYNILHCVQSVYSPILHRASVLFRSSVCVMVYLVTTLQFM